MNHLTHTAASRRLHLLARPALRLWFVLALFSSLAQAAPSLEDQVVQAMAGTATPAIAVLIIRDGKIADQAVHGVRRNDRPGAATSDDLCLLGSTSKVMTVALISRLG